VRVCVNQVDTNQNVETCHPI